MSKLKLAQISLDAMDPDIHNARRGFNGAFKDAIDAINALQKVNVPIEISTTVSDQSFSQLIDIAKYCESINASLIIRQLVPEGRCSKEDARIVLNISLDEIKEKLRLYTKVIIVGDRFNYIANTGKLEEYFESYEAMTIGAVGEVRNGYMKNHSMNSFINQLKVA